MEITQLIKYLKQKTTSLIKNEDWEGLFKILDEEPQQLLFFARIIEQQYQKSKILENEIYEPIIYNNPSVNDGPTYYRFIKGIEFILKLIRRSREDFTTNFREFLCDNLYKKLKQGFGYSSTLDLFYDVFNSEILKAHKNQLLKFPHILEKVIKDYPRDIIDLYPEIICKKQYRLAHLLILEDPNLLKKYSKESEVLVSNIVLYEKQYTHILDLLTQYNPKLIEQLEKNRTSLKALYLEKLINSDRDSIDLNWFRNNGNIFRYTLYLYTDKELLSIIKKIVELGFIYEYNNNDINWTHMVLLEIAWLRKAKLFETSIKDLVKLNHLQVVQSYFFQLPERIKSSQNFIINDLGWFSIDLLCNRLEFFNIPDPVKFFKSIIEKDNSRIGNVIQIFFQNYEQCILEFKKVLLNFLKNIIERDNYHDDSKYYFIGNILTNIYYYYPNYKLEVDIDLINSIYTILLSKPLIAEHIHYEFVVRENFSKLNLDIQRDFIKQIIKNRCLPCIEYYIGKNIDIFCDNLDIILSYVPEENHDSDYFIRPLEYIIRKKHSNKKIRDQILERIGELAPTPRKAELFLLLHMIDDSLKVYYDLMQNSNTISKLIIKNLDYNLANIENLIDKGEKLDIYDIKEELRTLETEFNDFNSNRNGKLDFILKKTAIEARICLYEAFQALGEFDYKNSRKIFKKTEILYRDLSKIETDSNLNSKIFKLNSKICYIFRRKIRSIKNFLKKGDIERANKLISDSFSNLGSNDVSDIQIERHIKNILKIIINPKTSVIAQFKSEIPLDLCTTAPKVINKKLLDQNKNVLIEWDGGNNILEINSIVLSEDLRKLYLDISFKDKSKKYHFIPKILHRPFITEESSIKEIINRPGMISYELWLSSKKFLGEDSISIILTEKNICAAQIHIVLPIISIKKDLDKTSFYGDFSPPTGIEETLPGYANPIAYEGHDYPYNKLESRRFEELLYHIFDEKIKAGEFEEKYDKAHLMPGVGEQGRDVSLTFKGVNRGLVQCKKNNNNLNKGSVAKEIIKFILYSIKDKSLIPDITNFTYYIATSKGYSNNAIKLLSDFKKEIIKDKNLRKWTEKVIRTFKRLKGLKFDEIEQDLVEKLSKLEVKYFIPQDIEKFLIKYQDIVSMFFRVRILDKNFIK
ncbi:MAG: hypothetical protein ACFFBP_05935 [Promethearchaeota archaeon]